MSTMQLRRSASPETVSYVFHPSFREAGAVAAYGTLPVDDQDTASQYMPDEVTRDCARRMHYSAFRAQKARTRSIANMWRQRYYSLRERIILGNRKLIYRAISRFRIAPSSEDLIGECHVVMIRAVAAYNPWLGIRFSTYACTCLFRALSRLGKRHSAKRWLTSLDWESLTEPQAPADEPSETPSEWPLVMRHLRDEDSLLSLREKRILEHRFGLIGACPSTLDQVAVNLGISKERVRQLQSGALGKLRQVLLVSPPPS